MEITSSHASTDIVNNNIQTLDIIKADKSQRSQLKKASQEFEAIFASKMLSLMDKTVDKDKGLFGEEEKYMDTFKSHIFNEMGRQIAKNPATSFGFAKQMYAQMEKYLPPENAGEEHISEKQTRLGKEI
jgi:Rod binding domain-containing protein